MARRFAIDGASSDGNQSQWIRVSKNLLAYAIAATHEAKHGRGRGALASRDAASGTCRGTTRCAAAPGHSQSVGETTALRSPPRRTWLFSFLPHRSTGSNWPLVVHHTLARRPAWSLSGPPSTHELAVENKKDDKSRVSGHGDHAPGSPQIPGPGCSTSITSIFLTAIPNHPIATVLKHVRSHWPPHSYPTSCYLPA